MVTKPNWFEDPEFLKDLRFICDWLAKSDMGQPGRETPARSDITEITDALTHAAGEARLIDELERACLATGATGAAIALVRGQEMVCQAAVGSHAPTVGGCLDSRAGLSGSCIQTRRLQQCVDTQTDSRVDTEACQHLGVRSIVALPLMDGDELFGIVEVLSSRPNAFSAHDLDSLKALTDRLVETRRQDRKTTATVAREGRSSSVSKVAPVPQDESHSSEPKSEPPHRERVASRNDMWTLVLGTLVIGVAILLGTLMGWRLGWKRSTLEFRASSALHRVGAPSTNARTDHAVSPGKQPQPGSAGTEDCGQSAPAGAAQSLSGGLTICQEGQVIFRLPPSAPLLPRTPRASRHLTDPGGDTARP